MSHWVGRSCRVQPRASNKFTGRTRQDATHLTQDSQLATGRMRPTLVGSVHLRITTNPKRKQGAAVNFEVLFV